MRNFDVRHVGCVEIHHHERGRREAGRLVDKEMSALRVGIIGDDDTRWD